MSGPVDHCRDVARRRDRPRYLAALFLVPEARPAAWATIAFNDELARIAEIVSEPLLGEMRLQWWRDAVVAPQPADNPVLHALAETGVDKAALTALVDARAPDLYPEPFADLPALEAYATATAGNLLVLWQRAAGISATAADTAARALGTAWGILGLHKAASYHATRGKTYLPPDTPPAELAARAAMYLDKSQDVAAGLDPEARRALRLTVIARRELSHLLAGRDRPRFDALDPLWMWLG